MSGHSRLLSFRAPLSAMSLLLLLATSAAAEDDGPRRAAKNPDAAARSVPAAAADLEKLLGDLEREQRDTQRRFDALAKEADVAGERALVRGRAYARLARIGFLPLGGGFRALVDHATRLEWLRHGIEADLTKQKRATVARAKLARRLEELRTRIEPLESEQRALSRVTSALMSAEDRERAFQRAFQASTSREHSAVYGASGPADPAEIRAGFAGMKGRLPFPITGRAEVKIARRDSDGPGLEMRAPLGTPVRAIYPGRVAFADSYAAYGKTVIIDHGGRYYTVSANLGSIDVHVGDLVELSTRLGTVGDVGQGALVYIEIRSGTETLDPAAWFGL